ncbi:2'-5' RNA ligase family protein [Pseudonocardia spirodelae]|uniref:2'-5' RNA ligase family protein n=1 Tax=Pseudonocardia spirodelae TaxID=3133431 RepID=A0ABU8T721_9PSEU
MDDRPLILTALLDDDTQGRFDDLRTRHFPPGRNHLAAHLTLFHALPGDAVAGLTADLTAATARGPMTARVTGLRLLGRGVAYTLDCPGLTTLRRAVADRWRDRLTHQDAGKSDLHVTVQNKVAPAAARALHDDLAAGFAPWDAGVPGLALWRYDGGPWEPGPRFPFSG